MTDAELDALRQRNEERRRVQDAASPGPRSLSRIGDEPWERVVLAEDAGLVAAFYLRELVHARENARLLVVARNDPVCDDIAALLAMVDFQARLIHDLKEESSAYERGKQDERKVAMATVSKVMKAAHERMADADCNPP